MQSNDNLERRIIDSATQLFIEKGFEQTSMSDIASEAGINRTTLHYYYRTKEKMFQAVFGSIMQSFLPKIQVIFVKDIPLIDKLAEVLDEYIHIFSTNPYLPRFILGEIQRDVNHLLAVGRVLRLDGYLKSIEQVLLSEMEKGSIKKVPIPVILLTFMSQVTFPFLAQNLMVALFYENEQAYRNFLQTWKTYILTEMRQVLLTGEDVAN